MITFLITLLWRWLDDDVALFGDLAIEIYYRITKQNQPLPLSGMTRSTIMQYKFYQFRKKIGLTKYPTEK